MPSLLWFSCKFAVEVPFYAKEETDDAQAQERQRPVPQTVDPAAALRGFFAIMQAWGLNSEDARALLGAPAERTFYAWRAGNAVRMPMDTLRRIGYVAGIYKALELLYSRPAPCG